MVGLITFGSAGSATGKGVDNFRSIVGKTAFKKLRLKVAHKSGITGPFLLCSA